MSSIVDHIAILVEDLSSSVEWYLETLGGTVTHKQENYVRIKVQNTNIALLGKNFSSSKPHIAILCDEITDLPISGSKVNHRDGSTGVHLSDPDGNMIEFIYYGNNYNNFIN